MQVGEDPAVQAPLEKAAVPLLEARRIRLKAQKGKAEPDEGEADEGEAESDAAPPDVEQRLALLEAEILEQGERLGVLQAALTAEEAENTLLRRDAAFYAARWDWAITFLYERENMWALTSDLWSFYLCFAMHNLSVYLMMPSILCAILAG